jgi:hypothetical protein
MQTLTVISHIFNEEYLLPFWLEYHSTIFDHGIIIDYCSTDNSLSIIKKFCPSWTIIKTRNVNADGKPNFNATLVDEEVQDIEKTIKTLYSKELDYREIDTTLISPTLISLFDLDIFFQIDLKVVR